MDWKGMQNKPTQAPVQPGRRQSIRGSRARSHTLDWFTASSAAASAAHVVQAPRSALHGACDGLRVPIGLR